MLRFKRVCELLAARRCYEAGQSPRRIAGSAGVHVSTIYRWLRISGASRYKYEKNKNEA